jgi:hypothetical protein
VPLATAVEHIFLVARGRQVDSQDQAAGRLGAGQQLVEGAVRQMMHARGGGIGKQALRSGRRSSLNPAKALVVVGSVVEDHGRLVSGDDAPRAAIACCPA